MTAEEMLALATRFEFGAGPSNTITVELRDNGKDPRGSGEVRWAVCSSGRCLSRSGKWDFEPRPSSRTDAWLERHRFTDVQEALRMAAQAAKDVANKDTPS